MDALNDAYYRELKGSVRARAFYEWFKRNNARQRKSLEDKGKETGKKRKVPEQFRKDMEERRRKREADGTARREMEPIPEYYTEKVHLHSVHWSTETTMWTSLWAIYQVLLSGYA